MNANTLKRFFVGASLVTVSIAVAAVNIPNTFTAGQPIKAAEVNANFSSLKTAVEALQAGPTIPVPLVLNGTGTGIAAATLKTTNTNGGIGAVISQSKAGVSDAALVLGQVGDGPLLKGFGKNGGEDEFRVDSNGTVRLLAPDSSDNITLDNSSGEVRAKTGTFKSENSGLSAESTQNTAVIATSRGSSTALIINQRGSGNIMIGRDSANAEVFRVTNNGNVQVQGVTLTSDRNAKKNFSSVNSLNILEKVVDMPISSWNYKTDADSLRHIGPMAQDFHATFGLNGSDDKHISMVDAGGVALAAVQGLNEKLEVENAALKARLDSLEARLNALENR